MKPVMFTTGNSILAVFGPFQRGTRIRGFRFETAPDSSADLGFGVNIFATRDKPALATYGQDAKSLIRTRDGEGDPLATVTRIPVGSVWVPVNFVVKTCVWVGVAFLDLGGATGDVDGLVAIDCDQSEEI